MFGHIRLSINKIKTHCSNLSIHFQSIYSLLSSQVLNTIQFSSKSSQHPSKEKGNEPLKIPHPFTNRFKIAIYKKMIKLSVLQDLKILLIKTSPKVNKILLTIDFFSFFGLCEKSTYTLTDWLTKFEHQFECINYLFHPFIIITGSKI